jgi:hypothetical protein
MARNKSCKKGADPKVQKKSSKTSSPSKTAMKAPKGGGVRIKATDEVSLTLTLKADGEEVLEIPLRKVPKGLVEMLRKLNKKPNDEVTFALRLQVEMFKVKLLEVYCLNQSFSRKE